MMRRALLFTAYDRPDYLAEVLRTWSAVRGLDRWHVVARIEPGKYTDQIISMFTDFFERMNLDVASIVVNPSVLGVLHHPWVGFEDLFKDYDFVVRTEDDLLVSVDILEYFEWASEHYDSDPVVASVHGFSADVGGAPESVHRLTRCSPLVWGTWRPYWEEVMGPTWDLDYSTFNGFPGNESGWDHNLNTRIYPKLGLVGIYPVVSRVKNIGVYGTHSGPDNYYDAEEFLETTDPVAYHEVETVRPI